MLTPPALSSAPLLRIAMHQCTNKSRPSERVPVIYVKMSCHKPRPDEVKTSLELAPSLPSPDSRSMSATVPLQVVMLQWLQPHLPNPWPQRRLHRQLLRPTSSQMLLLWLQQWPQSAKPQPSNFPHSLLCVQKTVRWFGGVFVIQHSVGQCLAASFLSIPHCTLEDRT